MRWIPLEANPELFEQWSSALGLDTQEASFCDIYGLDPDLLSFVPRPVYAVLQLFPINEAYEKQRKERDALVKSDGSESGLMFFKQTIGNACGTMGLLHALLNSPLHFDNDAPIAKIREDCKGKSPAERAKYLETSSAIEQAHSTAAQGGQSQAPSNDEEVDLHFSCFVQAEIDGKTSLIELDGRRPGPINHGELKGDLLETAAGVVRKYMEISDSIQFNLIALTKPA